MSVNKNTPPSASPSTPTWLRAAPGLFLLLWSLGFPVAKIGTSYVDPIIFLTLRYALVLVVLAPLVVWLRPPLPKRRIDWLHLTVVGILIQTVYFGFCYTAFALGAVLSGTALRGPAFLAIDRRENATDCLAGHGGCGSQCCSGESKTPEGAGSNRALRRMPFCCAASTLSIC